MLDSTIIIGTVISIIGILKTFKVMQGDRGKLFIPILVCILAAGLNVLNAFVFQGEALRQAFKDGLNLGLASGGSYSMLQPYVSQIITAVKKPSGLILPDNVKE